MNKRWSVALVLGVVVLGTLLFSAWATQQARGLFHHGHFFTPERVRAMVDWKTDDFLDEIEATERQRTQVTAIKDRLMDKGLALYGEHSQVRQQILEELRKERPDQNRIHGLVDQMVESKKGFAHEVANGVIELHGVLNPTQRAAVLEELEKHLPAK